MNQRLGYARRLTAMEGARMLAYQAAVRNEKRLARRHYVVRS